MCYETIGGRSCMNPDARNFITTSEGLSIGGAAGGGGTDSVSVVLTNEDPIARPNCEYIHQAMRTTGNAEHTYHVESFKHDPGCLHGCRIEEIYSSSERNLHHTSWDLGIDDAVSLKKNVGKNVK